MDNSILTLQLCKNKKIKAFNFHYLIFLLQRWLSSAEYTIHSELFDYFTPNFSAISLRTFLFLSLDTYFSHLLINNNHHRLYPQKISIITYVMRRLQSRSCSRCNTPTEAHPPDVRWCALCIRSRRSRTAVMLL